MIVLGIFIIITYEMQTFPICWFYLIPAYCQVIEASNTEVIFNDIMKERPRRDVFQHFISVTVPSL